MKYSLDYVTYLPDTKTYEDIVFNSTVKWKYGAYPHVTAPWYSQPTLIRPSIPYIYLFDPMETTSIQLYCVFTVGVGRLDRVKQFLIWCGVKI